MDTLAPPFAQVSWLSLEATYWPSPQLMQTYLLDSLGSSLPTTHFLVPSPNRLQGKPLNFSVYCESCPALSLPEGQMRQRCHGCQPKEEKRPHSLANLGRAFVVCLFVAWLFLTVLISDRISLSNLNWPGTPSLRKPGWLQIHKDLLASVS